MCPVCQVHCAQSAVDAIGRGGYLVQVGEAFQVLEHAQPQIQPGRLRHDRDPATDLHAVVRCQCESGDRCRARGRDEQRAERPYGRRLAGTVRSQESEDLAVADLESHVVESHPATETLAQPIGRQGRRGRVAAAASGHRVHGSHSALIHRRDTEITLEIRRAGGPSDHRTPRLPDELSATEGTGAGSGADDATDTVSVTVPVLSSATRSAVSTVFPRAPTAVIPPGDPAGTGPPTFPGRARFSTARGLTATTAGPALTIAQTDRSSS